MLNVDFLTEWADALESGAYRQGRGALRREDAEGNVTWCCHGVGLDLARERLGLGEWRPPAEYDDHGPASALGLTGNRVMPPAGFVRFVGIDLVSWVAAGIDPFRESWQESLAARNDDGVLFPEIAALLRAVVAAAREAGGAIVRRQERERAAPLVVAARALVRHMGGTQTVLSKRAIRPLRDALDAWEAGG